jgi:hypothetical protein
VKPTDGPASATLGIPVCCDVLAFAGVQVAVEEVPALRQRPGPGVGQSLPANFLKHADEQTVVGLAAVLHAIHDFQLTETRFTDWGVVAAPCFLGRATLVVALQRYAAEGAWGLSPHFIPHRSQHAISGTVSQALKIHGPNFGAGGGPTGAIEALLAGAVLLEGERLPGVWVVLTGWRPEFIPDRSGQPLSATSCQAVALALGAVRPGWQGPRLRIVPGALAEPNGSANGRGAPTPPNVEALLKTLGDPSTPPTTVVWRLAGGGWLEFRKSGIDRGLVPTALRQRSIGRAQAEVPQAGAGTEKQR